MFVRVVWSWRRPRGILVFSLHINFRFLNAHRLLGLSVQACLKFPRLITRSVKRGFAPGRLDPVTAPAASQWRSTTRTSQYCGTRQDYLTPTYHTSHSPKVAESISLEPLIDSLPVDSILACRSLLHSHRGRRGCGFATNPAIDEIP